MKNPFICLDCEKHMLDHSTRSIDCQETIYKSSNRYTTTCSKQKSVDSDRYNTLKTQLFNTAYEMVDELMRLGKEIKHIKRGLFNQEAYQRDQALIRRYNELIHEIPYKVQKQKEREEQAKSETLYYLSRLGISKETALNYTDAYNYVYNLIHSGKSPDEVALSYAIEWNTSELSRRERLRKEAERLNKSILNVDSFIKSVIHPESMAVCYVHSIGEDDGEVYYAGYAIVSVEVADISSSHYLVLVYDKQQNNNGYPAIYGEGYSNHPSDKCLSYNAIFREIQKKQCGDCLIVMREKNSRFLEPIIRTFGQTGCYCLQCKAKLDIR